jgi:hypothetical protein
VPHDFERLLVDAEIKARRSAARSREAGRVAPSE